MIHNGDNEIVTLLNGLIETCKDSQKGYRTAADHIDNPELKQLLRSYANQRGDFAVALQAEVRRHRGHPEKSGSVVGALHRGWFTLKSTLLRHSEAAILAECERGEEAALKSYDKACHHVLPADLQALVARQYKEIRTARDRLHDLQPAVAAK